MHRIGIIGCGGIAQHHVKGLTDSGRAVIASAYDKDANVAQEKAKQWDAKVASSAEELIDAVDVVVIATPGFAHREYVEAAARRRKPILCEKPIALNMDDARAIREAVGSAGVPFMVNFTQRNRAAFCRLKEVQTSGKLGGTVSAWASLHAPASSARWRQIQQSGHWRASMELSGGRINEFCSHAVNWLLWVLGEPRTVYGKALHVTEGFELDNADYAIITCEQGVGLLDVHRHAGIAADSRYGIQGHDGSVALKDERVLLTLMDEATTELPPSEAPPTRHEEFLRRVEENNFGLDDLDDAIDTLRVCLAFNRSVESERVEETR